MLTSSFEIATKKQPDNCSSSLSHEMLEKVIPKGSDEFQSDHRFTGRMLF